MQRGSRPVQQVKRPKADEENQRPKNIRVVRNTTLLNDRNHDHADGSFNDKMVTIKEEISLFFKKMTKSPEFKQLVLSEVKKQTEHYEVRIIDIEKKMEILASKMNQMTERNKLQRAGKVQPKIQKDINNYSPSFECRSLSCSQKSINSYKHQRNQTKSFQEMISNSHTLEDSIIGTNNRQITVLNERVVELDKRCQDLEKQFEIHKVEMECIHSQIKALDQNQASLSNISIHTKKKNVNSGRSKSVDNSFLKNQPKTDCKNLSGLKHNLFESFYKKDSPEQGVIHRDDQQIDDMNYSVAPNFLANFEEITQNDTVKDRETVQLSKIEKPLLAIFERDYDMISQTNNFMSNLDSSF